MTRVRPLYLWLTAIWLVLGLVLSLALDSWLVPEIRVARAKEVESLVRLQEDALQYYDHRSLRDELIRRSVISDDRDFEEFRPAKRQDQARVKLFLKECSFLTPQTCANSSRAIVFTGPNPEQASIAVGLRTAYFAEVAHVGIWKATLALILGLIVGAVAWVIRRHGIREMERRAAAMRAEEERLEALARLSAQVAHDIRSPLAALSVVEPEMAALPEETRELVRMAIDRIRGIADQLLKKPAGAPLSSQQIGELLREIVVEKKIQFREHTGVSIDVRPSRGEEGLEALLQPVEFKRVLSNLINNSVESIEVSGEIWIELEAIEDQVEIRVCDTGRGIPSDVLARLTLRGETHGKEGGSGLGLYHARTSCEAWGGSLRIESRKGRGTNVILTLPRVQAATEQHFLNFLPLPQGQGSLRPTLGSVRR